MKTSLLALFLAFLFCASSLLCAQSVAEIRTRAEQGDALAQYHLAVCFSNGQGVEQNVSEAAKWYRKAADQGYQRAQVLLGMCYGRGIGVPKDSIEAYKWFNLAAAQGLNDSKTAAKYRDWEEKSMSPEQIAEAQKLSREWKAKMEWEPKAAK